MQPEQSGLSDFDLLAFADVEADAREAAQPSSGVQDAPSFCNDPNRSSIRLDEPILRAEGGACFNGPGNRRLDPGKVLG